MEYLAMWVRNAYAKVIVVVVKMENQIMSRSILH